MIGAFPWDPFPPGEPEPRGPDPLQGLAYRSAVTATDAYRSVRLALRRENGTLRVGNRFVPDGRYREIAFLAFGNAANAMALAALHAVGDRLTQGFLAGPEPPLPELPFRSEVMPPGWGGAPKAAAAVAAAQELGTGLTEQDLLLLLLSPGALRALCLPPPGVTVEEFARFLEWAGAAGAGGREVGRIARVLGTGAVGGRLAGFAPRARIATFLLDRGDGAGVVGGGPTRPVSPEERTEVRAFLERTRLSEQLSPVARDALVPGGRLSPAPTLSRPVLVASPTDALRAAADTLFDKGWTSRLAFLELREGPEAAADAFLARTDELVRAEGLTAESRTKGVATFAMTTLKLPEGVDEGPALGRFLTRARDGLRRREMSVGLFRTSGAVGAAEYPAGAVVGAPTDRDASVRPGHARAVPMRPGITDVGLVAVALVPIPASGTERPTERVGR